ncbi:hypothetical protein M433DRAFT_524150 [Acidomyces richmondensis BFW]|nr:MAG: hypothetical protein FE78DRAFT_338421 [Acidomyces sp. 'richmondensis']KYG40849.1 hypothetical protein M433DRAFT_524150 [Acidomyces richmondensis BFW]
MRSLIAIPLFFVIAIVSSQGRVQQQGSLAVLEYYLEAVFLVFDQNESALGAITRHGFANRVLKAIEVSPGRNR